MNVHSELLERDALRREVVECGYGAHLGITIVKSSSDLVVGELEAGSQHLTTNGRVHGGVIMGFADTVAAYATVLNLPKGASTTTLESKTNFLKGGRPGRLRASSQPLHIGRSTMVWQTTISDDEGRTVGIVTQTQMVLHGKGDGAAAPEPEGEAAESRLPEARSPAREATRETGRDAATRTAEQRRAQIVEAAFDVIAAKGFANASMREIAKAAGMPVPTMYQYLSGKDEILETIFDAYLGEVEARVAASAAGADEPVSKLTAAIATNLEEFDRFQAQIRVMNRETRSLTPEVRERVKAHMLRYIGGFRSILEEGVRSGRFRKVDPELVANFIPMLCEVWPLRQWSVGPHGLERVQAAMVDLVLHGLQARGSEQP